MDNMPKSIFAGFLALLLLTSLVFAQEEAFYEYEAGFKNFIKCELTRTDAVNHFKGKEFTITMINLHNIQTESGMHILTGAVQCFVEGEYKTLYPAVAVRKVGGKSVVSYYTIRKKDFRILGTELIRYPYKERCPWSRYWVDVD
ncbi:MAG: hypothetical protein MI892_27935 [Desulfobacterales bacterium]|nr:hypothetical protein [Desulfobacterales bacterium]